MILSWMNLLSLAFAVAVLGAVLTWLGLRGRRVGWVWRVAAMVLLIVSTGCAPRAGEAAPPAKATLLDGRVEFPSIGVSVPAPRGWVQDPDRTGSIGMTQIVTWLKPAAPESERAVAMITLIAVGKSQRRSIPPNIAFPPGPSIGGKPSLRVVYHGAAVNGDTGALFRTPFDDGYRVDSHGEDFYLLHYADDPWDSRAVFEAVAQGIRWSRPVPAYRALAMTGRRMSLTRENDLSFEMPDPFWNNPFRGSYYDAFSLADRDLPYHYGHAAIELHGLENATTTASALAAAEKMPLYAGERIAKPSWRQISTDPEVHVSEMSRARQKGTSAVHGIKMIVARSPGGRYERIALTTTGLEKIVAAYNQIMEAIAQSISTKPAPRTPKMEIRN